MGADTPSVLRRLEELTKVPARTDKVRLLKNFPDQLLLHSIFDTALNPYRTFGVGELDFVAGKPSKIVWRDNEVAEKIVLFAKTFEQESNRSLKISVLQDFLSQCSALQQKWVHRIILKNLRCGVNIKTFNSCFPHNPPIPEFIVQAATLNKHVGAFHRLDFKKYYTEPKLNGLRLIRYEHNATSRSGHPLFNMDFLLEQSKQLNLDDYVLDGEFVTENWSKSMSFARSSKTTQTDFSKSFWYIFDAIHKDEFLKADAITPLHERKQLLHEAFKGQSKIKNLIKIPVFQAKSYKEVMYAYKKLIDRGYEGLMLKRKDSPYLPERNKNWIKLKPEETLDLEIVDFKAGQGRLKAFGLGAIIVERQGVETAVSGMSDEMRTYIWNNRAKLIGTYVEVKYQELSKDGRLLIPRFVKLRPDK